MNFKEIHKNIIWNTFEKFFNCEFISIVKFVEFGDKIIIKTVDEKKKIIAWDSDADFSILDNFLEAVKEIEDRLGTSIDNLDEIFTDKELFDVIFGVLAENIADFIFETCLLGTVVAKNTDDESLNNNIWYISTKLTNNMLIVHSENDCVFSPGFTTHIFDGKSYFYHNIALEEFWNSGFEILCSEISKIGGSDVDVYTYKGKQWYIVPAINLFEIETLDSILEFYVSFENDPIVSEKIDKIYKLLDTTKKELLIRSFYYHLSDLEHEINTFLNLSFDEFEKIYETDSELRKLLNNNVFEIDKAFKLIKHKYAQECHSGFY